MTRVFRVSTQMLEGMLRSGAIEPELRDLILHQRQTIVRLEEIVAERDRDVERVERQMRDQERELERQRRMLAELRSQGLRSA